MLTFLTIAVSTVRELMRRPDYLLVLLRLNATLSLSLRTGVSFRTIFFLMW